MVDWRVLKRRGHEWRQHRLIRNRSAYPSSLPYPPINRPQKLSHLHLRAHWTCGPLSLRDEHASREFLLPAHARPLAGRRSQRKSEEESLQAPILRSCPNPSPLHQAAHLRRPARPCIHQPALSFAWGGPGDRVGSARPDRGFSRWKVPAMASADLLRKEEEFYSSLFDSAKGYPPSPFTRKGKKKLLFRCSHVELNPQIRPLF